MPSGFNQGDVEELLVRCHRRCCICHRFCGVKIEIDHIEPQAEGGSDKIENGIAVCFECHAEIHSYNDRHPRGRKFHPSELHMHKEQWLSICAKRPEGFGSVARESGVGPLQALIDELEFNAVVACRSSHQEQGGLFLDEQFHRAIREGVIATLQEELKKVILTAYVAMSRANQHIAGVMAQAPKGNPWAEAVNRASQSMTEAQPKIVTARDALLTFLSSEK
jgi:hypothetical protein